MNTLRERLLSKVEQITETGCWIFMGSCGRHTGYGRIGLSRQYPNGRTIVKDAHRASYEELVGPVPAGLQLDHICRVRLCVNPAHLRPVTVRENLLLGDGPTARYAARSACKRGHPYDKENTHYTKQGARKCRACDRDLHNARYRAKLLRNQS